MLKGLHEPGRGLAAAPRAEEKAPGEGAVRLQEQLSGAGEAVWWRGGCTARSSNPTVQAPEDRTPVHSPGSGLARDRQRPGGPRTTRTLLPRAEQIRGPAPEPPGLSDGLLRSNWGG